LIYHNKDRTTGDLMVYTIRFGTDGWRGRIAKDYTFLNLNRCAQGFATYLLNQGHEGKPVVVGYDKRFLSEEFSVSAVEVLAANGFKVYLTQEATPTPVISYSVVAKKAIGAINITASHNPPQDNGFKVRDGQGGAIAPDGLAEIEAAIPDDVDGIKELTFDEAKKMGMVETFDPSVDYIEHLKTLIDLQPIKDAGLTVLVDAMWGNGAGWFTRLLQGGKTKVIEVNNDYNPAFPGMLRPEPIPPNINHGLRETVKNNADVMLANDGDADRVGVGDENGEFINQLRVYGLLAFYLLEVRGERGPIVKTLSTTNMLNKLGDIYNVDVYDTGVGFKYVAPKMLEVDAMIGGEESGGYAFRGNVPERDGIIAGLYFLDMMVKLNKKPTELLELLFSKVGAHYYDRIDTVFSGDREKRKQMIVDANPETIGGFQVIGLDTLDGYKFNLEDGGWLLIRFSGTEPKIRVYCETTAERKVQAILEDGLRIAGLK
jgi:alpha-D-glucose phosphate-specific phosphoglucomutase